MSERGYIDNVPLRLTPKYYPQPRPQFKEIDIHIPIDALQDDYDFSLERSALTEVSAWEQHKIKEEQRRAEEAARRAQEEEERRLAEELRLKLEEEERLRKEEEERIRLEQEEVRRQEEERLRILEEERRKEEEEIRKAEEERRLAEEELKRQEEEERLRVEQQERLRLEEEARKVEEERKRSEEARRHQEEELGRLARMKDEVSSPSTTTNNLDNSTAGHESSKESSSSSVSSPEVVESTTTTSTNYCVGNNKVVYEACALEMQTRVVPNNFRRNTSINLSDFESDTANPFDNVEINSINEMEVLASILKNNSVSVPPSQNYTARCNQNLSSSGAGATHYGSEVSHHQSHHQQTPHSQHQLQQHQHQTPSYQQSSPAVNCYPTMHNNTHHQSYPAQPPPHSHHQPWNYFVPSPGSPSSTPELSIRRDVTTSAPPPLQQATNQSNNPVTSSNSFTKYYFPLLTSMADSNRDRQNARNNINHGYTQPLPISGAQPIGLNAGLNPFLNPSNSPVQQFPLLGSLSNPPQFQTYWGNDGQVAGGPLASQTCNMTSISQPNGPPISASKPSLSHSQTGTDLSASTANGSQHHLR